MMTPKEAHETSEELYKALRNVRRLRQSLTYSEHVYSRRVLEDTHGLDDLIQIVAGYLRSVSLEPLAPHVILEEARDTEPPPAPDLSGERSETLELRETIEQLKNQLQFADGVAVSALCVCGQATPAEGFRKAGWGWLGHHIGELAKERDEARAKLKHFSEVFEEKDWAEEDGEVLWWKLPVVEAPYVGSPLFADFPDYVTHWTRIPVPGEGDES